MRMNPVHLLAAVSASLLCACFMHHPLDPPEDRIDLVAPGEDSGEDGTTDDAFLDESDEGEDDQGFGFPEPGDDPAEEEEEPEEEDGGFFGDPDCEDPADEFEAFLCELEEGEEDPEDPFDDPFDNPFDPEPDNPFFPDPEPSNPFPEDSPLAEFCEDPGPLASLICGLFGGGFGDPIDDPEPEPDPEPDEGELDCDADDLSGFEQFLCDLQEGQ